MKILDIPQSGKAGLYVSYKGRNGQVRRSYVVPANPRTISADERAQCPHHPSAIRSGR